MWYNTPVSIYAHKLCTVYRPIDRNGRIMKALERLGKWIAVILFFLLSATLIVFLYDFYSIITKSTKSTAEEHLKQISETNALMIRERIQSDLDTVFALSGMFSGFESIDSPEAKIFLKRAGNELPFSTLMVTDLNGDYYTTNGSEINIRETQYLIGASTGDKKISVIYKNALYGRDLIALDSPIYRDGRIVGKVSGLYYSNYIGNILNQATSGNKHQYQIIDRDGNFILPFIMSDFHVHQNLYSFLDSVSFTKGNTADQIIQDFLNRKPGVSTYIENGKANYFCYVPIGVKDWYLITTAPNTGINLQTVSMENPTVMLALRIIILFIMLILYIIWRQIRYRIAMEKNRKELEILNERLQIKNESLKLKAENDLLTGLYNKMTSELAIANFLLNEGKEGRHALFIIDLDDFKQINDELGHLYGDIALTETANGIDHCLRTTDIKGRIGGDEFIILLKNINSNEDLELKAAELSGVLKEIKLAEDVDWKLSGSIGIAIFPDHAVYFKDLFLKADKAMYYSKELGKGTYFIYTGEIENS